MIKKLLTVTLSIVFIPLLSFGVDADLGKKKSDAGEKVDDRKPIPDTLSNSITSASTAFNNQVVLAVEEAKAKHNSSTKGVIITKTNSSNAYKYLPELEAFLAAKGYKLLAKGGVSMPLKGIRIVKHVNCFEIIIGSI